MLRDFCRMNGFSYICNEIIIAEHLWKDGSHLEDLGTNILRSNFIELVNSFLFDNLNNRFRLNSHNRQKV